MRKLLLLFLAVTGIAFTSDITVDKYLGFGILTGGVPSACFGVRCQNSDAITDVSVMFNSNAIFYETCIGIKGMYDFESIYAGAGLVASYAKMNKEYQNPYVSFSNKAISPVFTIGKNMGRYFQEINIYVPHFHKHETIRFPTLHLMCGAKF